MHGFARTAVTAGRRCGAWRLLPCGFLAASMACAPLRATALDLVAATPPMEITDGRATVGPRTLLLPPGGHWFYIDQTMQDIKGGARGQVLSKSETATLVQIDNGVFELGLRLVLLKDDLWHVGWGQEPCNQKEDIYRTERGSVWQSDCLRVRGRRADFARPLGGANGGSVRWLAKEHVRMPDVSVAIAYARYASSSFGQLTIVVPAAHFDRDDAAIAWAEAMRDALKPMFEHGQNEASLPPLPSPATAAAAAPISPAPPAPPAPATAPAASTAPVPAPVHQWGDR